MRSSISRRTWLQSSTALGASMFGWLPQLAQAADSQKARPKSCILLWLDGGPSQTHTFTIPDFEPDYKAIPTSVSGIQISEYLPKLAKCMDDLAIIRSMSTGLNNHAPGQYLMHTGYRSSVAVNYPSLGAIVAKECGVGDTGLPNYINLGSSSVPKKFQRSGALGANYAPMMLKGSSVSDIKPPIPVREAGRLGLLQQVQQAEIDRFGAEPLRSHAASYRKAIELMHTEKTKAFKYKDEPQDIQERYGKGGFGTQCLQARRLIEAGVAFVEVNWGGWDHHGGAAEPVKKRSPELDQGLPCSLHCYGKRTDQGIVLMRAMIFGLLLMIAANGFADDRSDLVGTWKITVYQDDGKDRLSRLGVGKKKNEQKPRVAKLVFTADECYILRGDGRREMASGLANAGFKSCKLDSSTALKSIDIDGFAGKNNEKTKTYLGIYKIDGDKLMICYCEQGKTRPAKFESDGANNLFVAERISKEPLPIPTKQVKPK